MTNVEKLNKIAEMAEHYSKIEERKHFKEVKEIYEEMQEIINLAKEILSSIEHVGYYQARHDFNSELDDMLDDLFREEDISDE